MTCRSEFTLVAQAQILALEPRLRRAVRERVVRICQDPHFYGMPSVSPPYPPGHMMHEFTDHSCCHLLCILFDYDGSGLITFVGVGHIHYADPIPPLFPLE